MATITLIHTNDLHGKLSAERLPFLMQQRETADLYLDSGDCVRSGNLSVPFAAEQCWQLLEQAGCDGVCPGNRESHPLKFGKKAKFAGWENIVLCANWKTRDGECVFAPSVVFERNGVKVGVFGVMVAMVTKSMWSQSASDYLWDPPVETAVQTAKLLRQECDLVVALTHIGARQDRSLAEATTDIDLILGGHSHTVFNEPERVNGVPIAQGGSHAKYIGRYVLEQGKGFVSGGLVPWE